MTIGYAAGLVVVFPLIFIVHELTRIGGNLLWLVGCAFVYTVGELFWAQIGYSLVSKVAPARLASMLMGMRLANFAGNFWGCLRRTFFEDVRE